MMKKYWVSLLAICSWGVSHAATLNFPNTVELMAVNGQKVKINGHSIELHEGKNEVVYRYAEVLKNGSNKRKYQSDPLVSVFDVPQNGDITVSHRKFNTYSMAEVAFRTEKVNWQLISSDGDSALLSPQVLLGNDGLFPYSDLERAIEKYNLTHNIEISPMALTPTSSDIEPKSVSSNIKNNKIQINTGSDEFIKEIKSWYLDASDLERKSLLKWMIEHN